MSKKLLFPAVAFAAMFAFHAAHVLWKIAAISEQWLQLTSVAPLSLYLARQEYWLGFSYALVAAFTTYAIVSFLQSQRGGVAGAIGGMTLSGVLYFAGCFLLGCCGSPMLAVYLGLFGASLLGITKPLTAALTLASVVIGYLWMERRSPPAACCPGGESAPQPGETKPE